VAVTADLGDAPLAGTETVAAGAARPVQLAAAGDVKLPGGAAPFAWGSGTKVLLVGGGSAHDFNRFFHLADVATLKAAGLSAHYTESPDVTVRELKQADAAILSVNRAEWATPELRRALFDFADAGKGLVLLHAGVWYNFPDWPEYNRRLAGGGSRGHDRLGEFTVNVLKPGHPITQGLPAGFKITDELYYMTPDAQGAAIEVLAETSPSEKYKKPHPSVWVVSHPKARVAGIALGHDGRAHSLPEFQKLLVNAVHWAAGK
jgi:type 1 glutamine amidotransferase